MVKKMKLLLYRSLSFFSAFSMGVIVSGGIFSFIAMIGIIPRLAQKTKTTKYIRHYENVIIGSGLWGASTIVFKYELNLPAPLIMVLALCGGIFLGSLAVSITEVLDVIPILARRANILSSLKYLVLALALGKLIGTFFYYFLKLH